MTTNTSAKPGFFGAMAEIRKWMVVLLAALVLFFGYHYFSGAQNTTTITHETALIQQQIKNVGKLVVTEGHFAEVLTYKDHKQYLGNLVSFDKKALVIINAEVTVSFDLRKIEYRIDAPNKRLLLTHIPEEEIKISPDIKYYDVEQSAFNNFTGEDYNKINTLARASLAKKIARSSLKANARNRLVSELAKVLVVTRLMGWTLVYNGTAVDSEQSIDKSLL